MNIFHLVGFLKPWFLTNITSPGAKKTQGFARCLANSVKKPVHFRCPPLSLRLRLTCSLCHSQTSSYRLPAATYLPPSLSFATYLPLPLPTTTCHYPPATTCHILPLPYLPISSTLYLPLPFSLYLPLHYVPLPATTSTCQYLPLFPPATIWHYLHLPLPAATCHCLPLSVTTWLPATTSNWYVLFDRENVKTL